MEGRVKKGELIDDGTDPAHALLPIRIEAEIAGSHLPRSANPDQAL